MPTPTQDLRDHLRTRTAAAHRDAEASVDLNAALTDRDTYAAYLHRMRAWHRAIEPTVWDALDAERWSWWTDHRRRVLDRLDADLAALPAPAADEAPPPPPVAAGPAAALGVAYVVQGSGVGAQIIARRARQRLGPDLPAGFLHHAAGADADPPVWPRFIAALNASEADPAAALRGADAAFASFGAYLVGG